MFKELQKEVFSLRVLIFLTIIAISIYLFNTAWTVISMFSDLIMMLITAWVVSILLEPLVHQIMKLTRLSIVYATFIVYLLITIIFTLFIFLLIPNITLQFQTLAKIVPAYLSSVPFVTAKLNDTITSNLTTSIALIPYLTNIFFSTFLILIFSFYFIVDSQKINKEFFLLVPRKWHANLNFMFTTITESFGSFLRIQTIFGIMTGIGTYIILTIFHIDFAASTSVLAGILAIVPLLGPLLSLIPPVFVALIADPTKALFIFLVIMLMQQVIFNIIAPKLLGRAFKIHPVIIFISFLVGSKIAGSVGAIFAVPVIGALVLILREFSHFFISNRKE